MRVRAIVWVPAAIVFSVGCTDGSSGRDSADGDGIVSAGADTDVETGGADGASGPASAGTSGSQSGGSGEDGNDDDDDDIKWDLGTQPDVELGCGGGGGGAGNGGEPDFSYIWIANSAQGTISKINTVTMEEEGRYLVRPDGAGSPSRTSVNLNGDVAVASRSGGLTKVYARHSDCDDPNNTSTGPNDIKPWPDGCVAWHVPFAYGTQRPVAWTQGTFNAATCRYDDTKVWTSGGNPGHDVILVDGDSGNPEQTISIAQIPVNTYGIYGGAVDGNGDFWGSQLGQGTLVNVSLQDYSVKTWPMAAGGYGMTVDHKGNVWTCSNVVARFDTGTETWQTATAGGNGGCMEDGQGTLWLASSSLVGVDIDTMQVVKNIPLPKYVHGVSIDFYGYVWGVTLHNPEAYRLDPQTEVMQTFTGLTQPYTYSDMTGFALSNVGGPTG
jgi:hypothetical protein